MTLIAIHMLQNHAPSNLNRDDNGDPKDAVFGGVRRARISSQALKRSIRRAVEFRAQFEQAGLLGFRTKLLPEKIGEVLNQLGASGEERTAILAHAVRFGKRDAKGAAGSDTADDQPGEMNTDQGRGKKGKSVAPEQPLRTAQLMFLTQHEVDALATRMLALCRSLGPAALAALETEKMTREHGLACESHAVDVGMFGRMTTSSPLKNVEAAVQVAHAISTHKVEQEFDYFTAVDDLSGESGAGMIGDVAFNSATYYKYVNIHWEELVMNLAGEREIAVRAVAALLRAAMTAIPTGKQNSFAAHNLPDFALVEVLEQNTPVSYANAFLRPVRPHDDISLMEASIQAFATYAAPLPRRFDLAVQRAVFHSPTDPVLGEVCPTVGELAAWVQARLPEVAA